MFSRGYVEVLFKTGDTPLGREFDLALAGHAGVHLAAFSVADAEGAHRRLTGAGFAMRPLVQFQRPVETVTCPTAASILAAVETPVPRGNLRPDSTRFSGERWR